MWERATLKENAKRVLHTNYWMAFAVCLVAGILGGSASGGAGGRAGSTAAQYSSGGNAGGAFGGVFSESDAAVLGVVFCNRRSYFAPSACFQHICS